MSAACYLIDVDGEPASVRLAKPPAEMDPAELEGIREILRIARRKLAEREQEMGR